MWRRAIRDLIRPYEWASGSGVSLDEVAAAEQVLGPLPSDYKDFLSGFGWLEFGSYEVYGLGPGKPAYLDVTRMTLLERAQPVVPLPGSWVCVMNDGAGNLFSFDTKQVASGAESAQIFLWDHELGEDQDPEALASSFREWLLNMVRMEYL